MYDLNKRSYFTNLGELRQLFANYPDETEVCTGGVLGTYVHFMKDSAFASFDDEDLGEDDCYPELEDEETWQRKQELEHAMRLFAIETDTQFFFVGNKLMRTFLTSDGAWDYGLYDIRLHAVDSGQLGEDLKMSREEVTKKVMEWNNLDGEDRIYIPAAETLVKLTMSPDYYD